MNEEPREITNPFPGLRPFETHEYRLFFGREGQSDELIVRLGRARFLAVVGTSGSGKSSLVRAGLLPALRGGMMAGAGAGWRIAVMRPGGDPVGNLARSLAEPGVLDEAGGGLAPAEAKAVIEATLRAGSLGLVEAVRHARIGAQEKLLVIVDQFEELFRFRAARAASTTGDDAAAFVKLLLEASRQRELNVYVVLTMRSDFLGDCSQFQGLPEAINEGQYLIPRMNRDERRSAIKGPVGVARGKMSEPLVNRLLNDVGDNPDQLPILQHALMRTWDYWKAHARDREPLGLEHYEAIGTMENALSQHADEAFEELPDERSRQIAELLFKALTERGADNREIRRPTRLSDVCAITGASAAEVVAVVEVFRKEGRSFLMPPAVVALTPETVLDISHESLIRNWERLKKWVNDEAQSARIYKRVAEAAVLNREGKEGLLQDPGLSLALDWRDNSKPNAAWGSRYHPEFDTAISYLEQSHDAHEATLAEQERRWQEEKERERREVEQALAFAKQQARSARRLRWAAVAMTVLFVLSLGTAAYAFVMKRVVEASVERTVAAKREAVEARERAEEARVLAVEQREVAEEAKRQAVGLADDLKKNNEKLVAAQDESAKQAKRADERAKEAEEARKKALAAQERAEGLLNAAVTAQRQTQAAMSRSELTKKGLEAAQRNDSDDAQAAFENLAKALDEAIPHAPPEQVERLTIDRGWALSNLGRSLSNRGAVRQSYGDVTAARVYHEQALESYEQALDVLEGVWPRERQRDITPEPILFETYHGLGHAYQDIASGGYEIDKDGKSRKADSGAYYAKAEEVFTDALDVQKERLAKLENEGESHEVKKAVKKTADEVAAGYLNLARLYSAMGKPERAEVNLDELLTLRKRHGTPDEVIAARKELAEFYRNQDLSGPHPFRNAESSYYDLIYEQEKTIEDIDDFLKRGPELADSYYELAEVYRSQLGKPNKELSDKERAEKDKADKVNKEKADVTFAAATAIQRLSVSLRRAQSSRDFDAVSAAVVDAADGAGEAYLKLEKFDRARRLYEFALQLRETSAGNIHGELWKSYDKLTRLYRHKGFTFYAKAEEYNQKLIAELSNIKPNSSEHAEALSLCADIYAKKPETASAATTYYESARKIYAEQNDWMNENIVLFKLGQMYAKQEMEPEQRETARRRLELLSTEMNKIAGKDVLPRGSVTLIFEYLNAIEAVARLHSKDKNDAEAANVYKKLFERHRFIMGKFYNQKVMSIYVAMLDKYEGLLNKLPGRQADAAEVADSAKGVRERLNVMRILEQQSAQQSAQGPSQSATAQ